MGETINVDYNLISEDDKKLLNEILHRQEKKKLEIPRRTGVTTRFIDHCVQVFFQNGYIVIPTKSVKMGVDISKIHYLSTSYDFYVDVPLENNNVQKHFLKRFTNRMINEHNYDFKIFNSINYQVFYHVKYDNTYRENINKEITSILKNGNCNYGDIELSNDTKLKCLFKAINPKSRGIYSKYITPNNYQNEEYFI